MSSTVLLTTPFSMRLTLACDQLPRHCGECTPRRTGGLSGGAQLGAQLAEGPAAKRHVPFPSHDS